MMALDRSRWGKPWTPEQLKEMYRGIEKMEMQSRITELEQQLESANKELEAANKDALRLDWIISSSWYVGPSNFYCTEGGDLVEYEDRNTSNLREAIDAAMGEQG